nr:unnamed protein product [Callosobruchus chinensis]
MASTHFAYGVANGDTLRERRIYQKRYPNSVLPNSRTLSNIRRRLSETVDHFIATVAIFEWLKRTSHLAVYKCDKI